MKGSLSARRATGNPETEESAFAIEEEEFAVEEDDPSPIQHSEQEQLPGSVGVRFRRDRPSLPGRNFFRGRERSEVEREGGLGTAGSGGS